MSRSSVRAGEPQGNSGRKTYLPFSSHQTAAPLETQDVKTEYWPTIVEVHVKGMISVSLDSSSHTKKSMKFLNLR